MSKDLSDLQIQIDELSEQLQELSSYKGEQDKEIQELRRENERLVNAYIGEREEVLELQTRKALLSCLTITALKTGKYHGRKAKQTGKTNIIRELAEVLMTRNDIIDFMLTATTVHKELQDE